MTALPILDRLTRLYPKAIEPGLERTSRILRDLGDPHLKLPPVIHIAGTNGKGSTLAFIRAILEEQGKTCHVMTSPHLIKFNERFVIASQVISDDALEKLLCRVEKINAEKPVTFFEITTAAGFLAFAETPADYCLLETGMGGRLDSTNVVPNPALTIVTNISRDHTQHLGDTLKAIAFEKAGIIKPGVPCVSGPQTKDALAEGVMEIFQSRAAEVSAPLFRHGSEWDYSENENGFTVRYENKTHRFPPSSLLGRHQVANAATAIAGLLALNMDVPANGVTKAQWPARLQKITSGNLFERLPAGWELFLDGAHNEAGGEILAGQAKDWQADGKKLHLILGMLTTKDPEPFYRHVKPFVASATAIPIPGEKLAYRAGALAARLGIEKAPDPLAAIEAIVEKSAPGRILIAGSLYFAGSILKYQSDR